MGGAARDEVAAAWFCHGLGAFDNGDGTFTVLMNHELGATSGVARAHGGKGAFVFPVDRAQVGPDRAFRRRPDQERAGLEPGDGELRPACGAGRVQPVLLGGPARLVGFLRRRHRDELQRPPVHER